MSKDCILIIEDELKMRYLLRTHLSAHFEIDEAESGEKALQLLKIQQYSLVILDIMMEGMDGWEVCKAIRKDGNQLPILMLTARSDVKEKVHGLNLGADDYVIKPFDPDELVARIKALLRRSVTSDNAINREGEIRIKELTVNIHSREVYVNQSIIELTQKEFDLIYLLISTPNWTYTRDMLLDRVWGEDKILDSRTVDSHIKNVREKLKRAEMSFNPIKTVWGVGYKFSIPEDKND